MALEKPMTLRTLRDKAADGEAIVMLALYDFPFSALAEQAGIDGVIVGDSVAMALYGHANTLQADMDMMIRHTQAVRRGGPKLFVTADMPYMSYQPSVELAVRNAGRFMAEGGADAVKIEGGASVMDKIEAVVNAGIPVMGHLGFLPQSAAAAGGTRVPTRDAKKAVELINEAAMLDRAGISLLVLECVPQNVSEEVVRRATVPVIGIGSGPACHGQVKLIYDILGLYPHPTPRFVHKYAELAPVVVEALTSYIDQTRSGQYPAPQHCYNMNPSQQQAFSKLLGRPDA